MKITYLYRNVKAGFSIGRVFETLAEEARRSFEIENIYMPFANANPLSILKNILYAKKAIKKDNEAIFHITGDIHYLCWFLPRKKLIVTVHDIYNYESLTNVVKKKLAYIIWILPLKRAKKVIFISESTKKQVLEHIKLRVEQIEVILNPLSPDFQKIEKPINKEKPVILQLGTGIQKNLENLIPALSGINCHLRIIGVLTKEQRQLLEKKYRIDYSCVSNLTDKQVVEEYKNCDIVSLISLHEGFGMPIIEGQASNKPIITSNLAPMNEVAGKGACVVNPLDKQAIYNAYTRLITDGNYREDICKRGYENSKRFRVEEITKQYVAVYNQVLNSN
jgi:glycosyltransferase involved in cell wall biosynthesis